MTLITSISGIRGTIGGFPGDNLTPLDIVSCAAAYGAWLHTKAQPKRVVLGRDARISGKMVSELVGQTLIGMGIDLYNLDLSTTPTVEMAVPKLQAGGGIIITASHNPKDWNALKFLNHRGEFISAQDGQEIVSLIKANRYEFSPIQELGINHRPTELLDYHIERILDLPWVDKDLVASRQFKVAVDCINSTATLSVPPLLDALGCSYELINADLTGNFAHNPEPLPEHLQDLSNCVIEERCDLGIAVDPDVDRLALVCEDGEMFGEEYTIVAIADFILSQNAGNTVSNLSSTQALKVVTEKHGGKYFASAVGEVNVVEKMKEVGAIFGGEGNGGVIIPSLHYGRDALAGIAVFLTHLAQQQIPVSALKAGYPQFVMNKQKVSLKDGVDPDHIIQMMCDRYRDEDLFTMDGLKLIFKDEWVHMRKSNTEPIIRIYAESTDEYKATQLADKFVQEIAELTQDLS